MLHLAAIHIGEKNVAEKSEGHCLARVLGVCNCKRPKITLMSYSKQRHIQSIIPDQRNEKRIANSSLTKVKDSW